MSSDQYSMLALVVAVIGSPALIMLGGWAVYAWRRRQRFIAANEEVAGCVACGSSEVLRAPEAATYTCEACGYVGRADGGGVISKDEAGAFVPHQGRKAMDVFRKAVSE